ncbi:MAG TPA: hypothetical protein VHO47_05690 [Candidatus Babeliales bacterium]|nr:hypothetical protein [Candidatus Babeliales bacterium]
MSNLMQWFCLLAVISSVSQSAHCWNPFGKKKKEKSKVNQIATTRKKIAITNMERGDGFGAHVQQIIGAAIYAELNHLDFFYRPFTTMEHNYGGSPTDPDFLAKREKLINMIGNFPTIDLALANGYELKTDHYAAFLDTNIRQFPKCSNLKKIKEAFRANKTIPHYFDVNRLNIAVHIRRPNPDDNRVYGTDIPNNVYIDIIKKLRKIYAAQNPLFHIFSQGESCRFEEFSSPDTILHINEAAEQTYTALVLADVLVTGRSSFSYTAGYLSDGIVYYVSYMHAPFEHWISVDVLLSE